MPFAGTLPAVTVCPFREISMSASLSPAFATTTAKSNTDQTEFATGVGQKSQPMYETDISASAQVFGSVIATVASPPLSSSIFVEASVVPASWLAPAAPAAPPAESLPTSSDLEQLGRIVVASAMHGSTHRPQSHMAAG